MPPRFSLGDPDVDETDFADPSGSPSPLEDSSSGGDLPSIGGDLPATLPEFAALLAFAKKFGQTISQGSGIAPGFRATRASVVNSFTSWSGPFEGPLLPYPYTDAEGLVTVGTGNLIDAMASGQVMHQNCGHGTSTPCGQPTPTAKARSLPWSGGSIDADWAKIKAAWPKTQSTACQGITSARLSKDVLVGMVTTQLKANEADVLRLVPGFAQLSADAQLALHSMMWAMGSGKLAVFKNLLGAVNSGDFATAAAQSHMQGVGIDMRNLANKLLFLNAAAAKTAGLNPDHLYYVDAIGAAGNLAAGPMRFALRAMPKIDSGLLLDAGIILGCVLLGSAGGAVGAVAGLVVGIGVDAFRRLRK